jgi:flagellar protein FliO/FliZ
MGAMFRMSISPPALLVAPVLLMAPTAWAAGAAPGPGAGQLLQLIGGLLVVIAAVIVSARYLPRLQHGRGSGQDALKVIDSLMVGQKQRVVLMQVGHRQVLVGVTPAQVTALHVLDEPVAAREPMRAGADDYHWLAKILGRKTS